MEAHPGAVTITLTKAMIDAGVDIYRDWEEEKVLPFEFAMPANEVAVELLIANLLRGIFAGHVTLDEDAEKLLT